MTGFYKGKHVIVTGGAGYIGSALVEKLNLAGAHVTCLSRRYSDNSSGITILKGDIKTKECWLEIVKNADIIFHLAGNTSVYLAAADPEESFNSTVLPITHLISAAQDLAQKPKIIYASTVTVYGLNENFPLTEETPLNPVTTYDAHKVLAEEKLKSASAEGILESVSLRLSNVYGPSLAKSASDDRGILNKVTRMALMGQDIQLFGDGNYLRDYVHIDDVVTAFLVAGSTEGIAGCAFNIATGKSISIRDAFFMVVENVKKIAKKEVQILSVPWPDNADPIEFRNFITNTAYFEAKTGWRSKVSIEMGINSMIAAFNTRKYIH